jgi:erythromycin esterase-like protein
MSSFANSPSSIAIGVVYLPEDERRSHYFRATLACQFDVVLHVDETHAVDSLERADTQETGEAPLTCPAAF